MRMQGLTLIEMVVVIIILSIAMLPILTMFGNVLNKAAESQIIPVATLLGQDLLEEIEARRYDEHIEPPWTAKKDLGEDDGEDSSDKDTFDDADDFIDWEEDPISGYPGYSSSVEVYYVEPDDLNTEAAIGPTGKTDFKKIIVKIFWRGEEKISLVTVMQGY